MVSERGASIMLPTSASLLDRLHSPTDPAAWDRLTAVYSPLIRGWLQKQNVRNDDAEDLVQEVLIVVIRRIPEFQHNGRTGAFRAWLRMIAVNVSRDFWKAKRLRPAVVGGSDFGAVLDRLADSSDALSREWDKDHDLFVTRRLLELLRPQFEATTWTAFERFALKGEPAAVVAADLGITSNAIFIAKSRILTRLREEAAGLLDS